MPEAASIGRVDCNLHMKMARNFDGAHEFVQTVLGANLG